MNMEDYFRVKCRLFSQTKNAIAVVNGDDAYGQRLIKSSLCGDYFWGKCCCQVRADR